MTSLLQRWTSSCCFIRFSCPIWRSSVNRFRSLSRSSCCFCFWAMCCISLWSSWIFFWPSRSKWSIFSLSLFKSLCRPWTLSCFSWSSAFAISSLSFSTFTKDWSLSSISVCSRIFSFSLSSASVSFWISDLMISKSRLSLLIVSLTVSRYLLCLSTASFSVLRSCFSSSSSSFQFFCISCFCTIMSDFILIRSSLCLCICSKCVSISNFCCSISFCWISKIVVRFCAFKIFCSINCIFIVMCWCVFSTNSFIASFIFVLCLIVCMASSSLILTSDKSLSSIVLSSKAFLRSSWISSFSCSSCAVPSKILSTITLSSSFLFMWDVLCQSSVRLGTCTLLCVCGCALSSDRVAKEVIEASSKIQRDPPTVRR